MHCGNKARGYNEMRVQLFLGHKENYSRNWRAAYCRRASRRKYNRCSM